MDMHKLEEFDHCYVFSVSQDESTTTKLTLNKNYLQVVLLTLSHRSSVRIQSQAVLGGEQHTVELGYKQQLVKSRL